MVHLQAGDDREDEDEDHSEDTNWLVDSTLLHVQFTPGTSEPDTLFDSPEPAIRDVAQVLIKVL